MLEDTEGPDGKKSNATTAAHKTGRFEAGGDETARILLTARNWPVEHGFGGDTALVSSKCCAQDAKASRSASLRLTNVPYWKAQVVLFKLEAAPSVLND